MLDVFSIGTYAYSQGGDKVSALLTRVANVVIQVDEQMKLVISPTLQAFVTSQPDFRAGPFQYAAYFGPAMPNHLGIFLINGKTNDQPCHVYTDDTLADNAFRFVYRGVSCVGTLSI
jgi:hypothetical protein